MPVQIRYPKQQTKRLSSAITVSFPWFSFCFVFGMAVLVLRFPTICCLLFFLCSFDERYPQPRWYACRWTAPPLVCLFTRQSIWISSQKNARKSEKRKINNWFRKSATVEVQLEDECHLAMRDHQTTFIWNAFQRNGDIYRSLLLMIKSIGSWFGYGFDEMPATITGAQSKRKSWGNVFLALINSFGWISNFTCRQERDEIWWVASSIWTLFVGARSNRGRTASVSEINQKVLKRTMK